jgi:hypothetical protein
MQPNVGKTERWITGLAGAALLGSVFFWWSPWRLLGAAALFFRAFSGVCGAYQLFGVSTCKIQPKR